MQRFKQPLFAWFAGMLGLELAWLTLLNPQSIPSYGFIVPFLLLFGMLYIAVLYIVGLTRSEESDRVVGLRLRRPRVVAAFGAGFPVMLLILQSIDQLTAADLAATTAIFIIGYIYITRSAVSLTGFKKR